MSENTFKLMVCDPPASYSCRGNSWLQAKYGVLPQDWKTYINQGMHECIYTGFRRQLCIQGIR